MAAFSYEPHPLLGWARTRMDNAEEIIEHMYNLGDMVWMLDDEDYASLQYQRMDEISFLREGHDPSKMKFDYYFIFFIGPTWREELEEKLEIRALCKMYHLYDETQYQRARASDTDDDYYTEEDEEEDI